MSELAPHAILEAAIFAAGEPVTIDRLALLFEDSQESVTNKQIKTWLDELAELCESRGVTLVQIASGYRFQAKQESAEYLQHLWSKKPPRYTRAFLETLALIAYKQPITRGEIEEVRGVAVSANIMRQLLEREWVKIVGHKDVPGKPALFSTTKQFLDYFGLKKLAELPPLPDVTDLDSLEQSLTLQLPLEVAASSDDNAEPTEVVSLPEQRAKAEAEVDALVEKALADVDALEKCIEITE